MKIEPPQDGQIVNVPGALEPVPWYMRYTLPLAALTGACLGAFGWWLLQL